MKMWMKKKKNEIETPKIEIKERKKLGSGLSTKPYHVNLKQHSKILCRPQKSGKTKLTFVWC